MNNFARHATKMLRITNHAIIKARANSNQHIAMLHGHVCFVGAMHTEHANEFIARRTITTQAHQRIGAGIAEFIDQGIQFRRSVGKNHTATGVNHRTLCAE